VRTIEVVTPIPRRCRADLAPGEVTEHLPRLGGGVTDVEEPFTNFAGRVHFFFAVELQILNQFLNNLVVGSRSCTMDMLRWRQLSGFFNHLRFFGVSSIVL